MKTYRATVLPSRISLWGEGPIWHSGRLYYVDIEDHKVVCHDPESHAETVRDAGERVGTVVPRANGGLVLAGDNGFSFFDPETARKSPIADPEAEKKPDNRFNDGKCDPAGRFWAGTISTVKKTGNAALYMLDTRLNVHQKLGGITNSNGIVWSADTRRMYYIDTPRKKVLLFDFDNATGEISGERTFIDSGALGIAGSPDGMAIDSDDCLWVAFCRAGCILAFDPVKGEAFAKVEVPGALETTACAFGGKELADLYITTGQRAGQPEENAGKLFVAQVGARGVPSVPFAG